MKAAERVAVVAVVAEGRVDIGAIEVEVECVDCRDGATRPVEAMAAGVAQSAISNPSTTPRSSGNSATDKEEIIK